MMKVTTLLCAATLTATIALAVGSNTVRGTMTVNGKKTEFHHVTAVAAPSMFHEETRKDLVIVLSDQPVSASEILGRGLTSRWMDGKLSALLLRIQPWDKQVVSGNLYAGNLAKEGQQISGNNMADFLPTKFEPNRVEGRVSQKKYGDDELSLAVDATFAATVEGGPLDFTSPEPAAEAPVEKKLQGKPLPAGGGEPGAAYLAFVRALHSGNAESVKKYLGARLKSSAAEIKEILPMLQGLMPKDVKVLGGVTDGTNAELDITSANGKAVVKMVREKDGWKFAG